MERLNFGGPLETVLEVNPGAGMPFVDTPEITFWESPDFPQPAEEVCYVSEKTIYILPIVW